MMLGENIYKLRKQKGLSQEQLGEQVHVTRQTISNWELNETSPNPEQLKLLSKALNVSIDELLNNDIQNALVVKSGNTEKLAGIVMKILKVIGVVLILFVVVDIIAFILFVAIKSQSEQYSETLKLSCSIDDSDYLLEVGMDGYFNCSNCPKEMQKDLKDNYVDFGDLEKTEKNIYYYFSLSNGLCE